MNEIESTKIQEEISTEDITLAEQRKKDKIIAKKRDAKLKYECDKDREKVKGIFRFFAVPGGILSFPYRKYKWDKTERYELVDGGVYTIPIGVAKHLNNGCWYPEHEYIPGMNVQTANPVSVGGQNSPMMRIARRVHRTAFQPLDFTDVQELNKLTKEVVTVDYL